MAEHTTSHFRQRLAAVIVASKKHVLKVKEIVIFSLEAQQIRQIGYFGQHKVVLLVQFGSVEKQRMAFLQGVHLGGLRIPIRPFIPHRSLLRFAGQQGFLEASKTRQLRCQLQLKFLEKLFRNRPEEEFFIARGWYMDETEDDIADEEPQGNTGVAPSPVQILCNVVPPTKRLRPDAPQFHPRLPDYDEKCYPPPPESSPKIAPNHLKPPQAPRLTPSGFSSGLPTISSTIVAHNVSTKGTRIQVPDADLVPAVLALSLLRLPEYGPLVHKFWSPWFVYVQTVQL